MRLIATDLDGTLLNDRGVVSEANIRAILSAIDKGMQFVVVTGRSYLSASKLMQAAGISCSIICLNGAEIRSENGTKQSSIALRDELSPKIINVCQRENVIFNMYTDHGSYTNSRERLAQLMFDLMTTLKPNLDTKEAQTMTEQHLTIEKVKTIEDHHPINDLEFYKIEAYSNDPVELATISRQLENEPELMITSSVRQNIEFNDINAQKGLALRNYAEQKGIRMEEVIAIGDSYNDVSMLKMAGRAVAMENAEEDIKEICHFITKKNSEDGVAFAVDELMKELEL
ncbi:hypothetical protein BKP45_00330 [Anaerobacillus alkalidiazotrophicus]|uniref:Hydrolase n=1 Tax=Anaerobacillus alkalidiazotrophicus TaxID=472963 RepID=A0A1S2MBM5_9BACI|nr:Cof-type HAD-IIB family hydrolase [Anaerobacillus alkalidiazotrophicus]OIJ21267.1 hypothetical protein BKP45_00330 [Anaerobacillus alkalidiazotrophicus]